eukprot:CAMPEP_0115470046 /NCGR_PEP_ID=MMETSP0271-20121206/51797_1 /TAXON_ID=71861 /ORGANISM="Scrippsiella trochoidea, Strain CCMP3099" /LENGTH=856 /DNA_ID=CAMNT_0002897171 /DNA_START=45 /DNA_END=2612 /DNA_ORIENTATION=+
MCVAPLADDDLLTERQHDVGGPEAVSWRLPACGGSLRSTPPSPRLGPVASSIDQAALLLLGGKLSGIEASQVKLDRKLSELNGALQGVSEEVQRQIRRGDTASERLRETRRSLEDEVRGRMAELEAKQQETLSRCRIAAASSEDRGRRLGQIVSRLEDRLLALEARNALCRGHVSGESFRQSSCEDNEGVAASLAHGLVGDRLDKEVAELAKRLDALVSDAKSGRLWQEQLQEFEARHKHHMEAFSCKHIAQLDTMAASVTHLEQSLEVLRREQVAAHGCRQDSTVSDDSMPRAALRGVAMNSDKSSGNVHLLAVDKRKVGISQAKITASSSSKATQGAGSNQGLIQLVGQLKGLVPQVRALQERCALAAEQLPKLQQSVAEHERLMGDMQARSCEVASLQQRCNLAMAEQLKCLETKFTNHEDSIIQLTATAEATALRSYDGATLAEQLRFLEVKAADHEDSILRLAAKAEAAVLKGAEVTTLAKHLRILEEKSCGHDELIQQLGGRAEANASQNSELATFVDQLRVLEASTSDHEASIRELRSKMWPEGSDDALVAQLRSLQTKVAKHDEIIRELVVSVEASKALPPVEQSRGGIGEQEVVEQQGLHFELEGSIGEHEEAIRELYGRLEALVLPACGLAGFAAEHSLTLQQSRTGGHSQASLSLPLTGAHTRQLASNQEQAFGQQLSSLATRVAELEGHLPNVHGGRCEEVAASSQMPRCHGPAAADPSSPALSADTTATHGDAAAGDPEWSPSLDSFGTLSPGSAVSLCPAAEECLQIFERIQEGEQRCIALVQSLEGRVRTTDDLFQALRLAASRPSGIASVGRRLLETMAKSNEANARCATTDCQLLAVET